MPHQHTILVVDDEAQIVKSVINLLRLKYRVLGAGSGSEALEILKKEKVHVVMSDQCMPEMKGVELLSKIHSDHPDIIRLLFTGYTDISAVIEAINKGNVYRYIVKPWNPEELEVVVHDACARYDLLEERRQLIEELQVKNEKLKASDNLKSAFIKVAGHEFRTPVTILSGLCKLAKRDSSLNEASKENLVRIETTTARLEGLVAQVLNMLSAEKFEEIFHCSSVDVASTLRQAVEDVQPFVDRRKQSLRLDFSDDLGTIKMDAKKMRDVLNNLLLNAVKFTPDAGEIYLKAHRDKEGIVVEVIDNGMGISTDSLPRMFEPFFTESDVSRHSSGQFEFGSRGLGLGLSLVKAFVEMHGGTASVESKVGKGSTFRIFLPQSPSDSRLPGEIIDGPAHFQ